ncbi:MAG: TetR/AcrR family transcriptional regulator C-terminal domain-containing protein [Oscillospiraceae bacterium]|nr:TetR/AcrR family transcriptional regulator C-terminal domain-containing protein [Oscillospiraceae bacterium]
MAESRRVRMTKKLIKDALIDLLETRPLNKITIKEICMVADVNRSTFYAYYETVDALLQEINEDVLAQLPQAPNESNCNSLEEFKGVLINFLDYVKENHQLFRVLMLHPNSNTFNHKLFESVTNKYRKVLLQKNSMTARYDYIFKINGFIGMAKDWVNNDFPISSIEFTDIALSLMFNNALPDK